MGIDILEKIAWSIFVSLGFAIMFNTPKRALWVVGLLGGIGYGIKTLLVQNIIPEEVIFATLIGASVVGISGVYFAHKVHTPPIVFTIPAVINMIPGKFGYEFIIGLIKLVTFSKTTDVDFNYFMSVLNNGLKASFILMSLAFGVIFPILVFNTKTVKDADLKVLIQEKIVRRVKISARKKRKR